MPEGLLPTSNTGAYLYIHMCVLYEFVIMLKVKGEVI